MSRIGDVMQVILTFVILKKILPLRASVWSKNKGLGEWGERAPQAPPLDPPTFSSRNLRLHLSVELFLKKEHILYS